MDLTPDEEDIIKSIREGRGVIINCNLGFGVRVYDDADGRVNISVASSVLRPGYDGAVVRSMMAGVVQSWSQELASTRAIQ